MREEFLLCAVLGRFLHSLNKFCEEEYGLHFDIPDYSVYEFAKVGNLGHFNDFQCNARTHSVIWCTTFSTKSLRSPVSWCRSGIALLMSPITESTTSSSHSISRQASCPSQASPDSLQQGTPMTAPGKH